nr:hypothetical protein [Candidatus Sigynarchaeota archaeon]
MFSVDEWLKDKEFSSYFAYALPDSSERPKNSIRDGNRWISKAPDGFTLGNSRMFAAIGVPLMDAEHINHFYTSDRNDIPFIKEINLANLSLLVGPDKATAHLQNLPAVYKVQDFDVSYNVDGQQFRAAPNEMPWQESRRVKNTAIISTHFGTSHVKLSTIDFCPRNPDDAVLYRVISVKNTSSTRIENLVLSITLENRASSWSWELDPSTSTMTIKETRDNARFFMRFVDESNPGCMLVRGFNERPERIDPVGIADHDGVGSNAGCVICSVHLGNMVSYEELVFYIAFVPSGPVGMHDSILCEMKPSTIIDALQRTEHAWTQDLLRVKFKSSNTLLEDLVDSIISMASCHISEKGIHTGSVYYSHGRAWTRDNYWIQKAFHHAGYHDAGLNNARFFLEAWQKNGKRFANSYGLNSSNPSNPGCEVPVELPWYFILMLAELRKWAPQLFNQLPRDSVRELITTVVREAKHTPDYLFPLNSDETWIWACEVVETGVVLDNSLLCLSALLAVQQWFSDLLESSALKFVDELAGNVRRAIEEKLVIKKKNRFAVARDDDGMLDESAVTIPLSMPFIHGLFDDSPELRKIALNGVLDCWQACRVHVDGGGSIVRSHSATTAMTGNTPGHFLEAIGKLNARKAGDEILEGILNFVNCTGAVNEIHDIFDPSWGTERRRLWDSMAIIEGVMQYLLGIRFAPDSIRFTPYCPEKIESVSIDEYPVGNHVYSFRMVRRAGKLLCAVKQDGIELVRYEGLQEIVISIRVNSVQLNPVDESLATAFQSMKKGEYWRKIIQDIGMDSVHGDNCAIVYDLVSRAHAVEVLRQLVFTRGQSIPLYIEDQFDRIRDSYEHFIWISKDIPAAIKCNEIFKDVLDEFAQKDYCIMAFDAKHPKRTLCWIPNKGHAYRDTNRFIQDVRLQVLPTRQKPMSMHPHGFLRFSDISGAKIDEVLDLVIESRALSTETRSEVTVDIQVFVQNEKACVFQGGSGTWNGKLPILSNNQYTSPGAAYLLITAMTPFAPFDIAAAGIATGAHAVQLTFQCDSPVPLELTIKLKIPQSWHQQNLRSPQWERIEDPVRIFKDASGEKELRVIIHPGQPINQHMRTRIPDTARHLTFVFVKYPRLE